MSLTLAWPASPRTAWQARWAAGAETLLAAERARLAPWLAVALGVGVLLYFDLPAEPPPAAWLAPPLLLLALWIGLRRPLAGWAVG
ncbi:MAG TPA: ComEC family competence protein, partial [Crenalkalicoccus sp.]|nr:ComEC family competence protein [Crenalkalicoccus sp.]